MKNNKIPPGFEIKVGIHGVGAFVTKDIKKGSVLFKLQGDIVDTPTRTSVQIAKGKHIEDALAGHINHSCSPNARVYRKTQSFISLRDIEAGEEITFNYNDNEDDLASSFVCVCCGKEMLGKLHKPEVSKV